MPRGGGLQVFNTNNDDEDDDDDNDNDDDEDEDDDLQYFRNITKSSSDPVGGMNLDMR